MVTIPKYENSVRTAPLADKRASAFMSPAAAGSGFGEALQRVGTGLASVAEAMDYKDQITAKADSDTAYTKYMDHRREVMYDPTTGYLNQTGANALGQSRDAALEELAKRRAEVEAGLSPRARADFNKRADSVDTQVKDTAIVHASGEQRTYLSTATTSAIKSSLEAAGLAYNDEVAQNGHIDEALRLLKDKSMLEGMDPETYRLAKIETVKSATSAIAVNMAHEDPVLADKYLDDHQNALGRTEYLRLKQGIKPAVIARRADGMVGPMFKPGGAASAPPRSEEAAAQGQRLLDIGGKVTGLDENAQNEALRKYLSDGGEGMDPATSAWAAAFVNGTLGQAGLLGTSSNMARSFLGWGTDSSSSPQKGDIVVLQNGAPPYGSVGFFAGTTPEGDFIVLGGDQDDKVGQKTYKAEEVLGVRRATAPLNKGTGKAPMQPHEEAAMRVIASVESNGKYNVIYGGGTFDSYADHPRKYVTITSGPNKGQKSSAAGKYQFLASTWDDTVADFNRKNPGNPITDFSPENQDRAAVHLARKIYNRQVGRDGASFDQVLMSGDPVQIGRMKDMLHDGKGGWEGFRDMKTADFVNVVMNGKGDGSGPGDYALTSGGPRGDSGSPAARGPDGMPIGVPKPYEQVINTNEPTNNDLSNGLSQIMDIQDLDVRNAALSSFEQRLKARDLQKSMEREQLMDEGWKSIVEGKNPDNLPAAMKIEIGSAGMNSLNDAFKSNLNGSDATDPKLFQHFLDMSLSSDGKLSKKFAETNLNDFAGELSIADLTKLKTAQAEVRDEVKNRAAGARGVYERKDYGAAADTGKDQFKAVAGEYPGASASPKTTLMWNQFQEALKGAMNKYADENGAAMPDALMDETIGALLMPMIVNVPWGQDISTIVAATPYRPGGTTVDYKMTEADVPFADRERLTTFLSTRFKRAPTQEEVVDHYEREVLERVGLRPEIDFEDIPADIRKQIRKADPSLSDDAVIDKYLKLMVDAARP